MAGSKKKKGKGTTLILLLIAMIALIGACVWVFNFKDKQEQAASEESSEEADTIASADVDKIQTISFKNANLEMTLKRGDDDQWIYADDENFPVNQDHAKAMMNAFAEITSSRTITDATDLSQYGLDNPTMEVSATLEDGTTTSVAFGSDAPVADGYYATLNGGAEVYIISATFYNNFDYNLTQMTAIEDLPSITTDNITHLAVDKKDGADFEVIYDKDNAADYAGTTNWTMVKPYATSIPADATAISTLMQNYADMSFLACVDYNATDLSKYGLNDPTATLSLEYYEEFTQDADSSESSESADSSDTASTEEPLKTTVNYTLDLLIGSTDADGNYYVKTKDSNSVNTMSADSVSKLIDIDAYSNADHYVNLINIESLSGLDISVDGKTYNITMDTAAQTAEEANTSDTGESTESKETTEEVTTYYFNGEQADEDTFKTLYQLIISPTTERDIPEEYFQNKQEAAPYMTVTYHFKDGRTLTYQYKPYDESYYVANQNGVEYFLTDLRKVQDIAKSLAEYKPAEKSTAE